jgi:hypothetical protein
VRRGLRMLFYPRMTGWVTADILSAVRFSPDGEFLATGDKAGRVVLFRHTGSSKVRTGETRTHCATLRVLLSLSLSPSLTLTTSRPLLAVVTLC